MLEDVVGASGDATVACPHCGGAIKPAAKLCKHCKKLVEHSSTSALPIALVPPEGAPQPTTAASVTTKGPSLPQVLTSLREFVGRRPFINVQTFDAALASRQGDDAAAVLRELAGVGHVTQVQAESLVAEFYQAQMSHAHALIAAATAQGLVPAAHAQSALASYSPMAFTATVHEHLIGSGLITRAQADALQTARQTPSPPTKMSGMWGPGAALLLLFMMLLSKSWWSAKDFSAGLFEAEICNRSHCQTKSYSDLLSDFENEGTADLLPAEFRAHVRDNKIAFVVGLLLVAAGTAALILRYRRSARTRAAAIVTLVGCGVFLLAVINALISGHAANNHDTSMSFAPIVALLASAFIARAAFQIRKAAQ